MAWTTIGHAWAVTLLKRQLAQDSLHHAYLLTGPAGVGREQLALDFASALLCERPLSSGEACGACRACRDVPARIYPDLHFIDSEEGKQGISIEQVRELQRQLSLSPLGGRRRVALLLNVDRASAGAVNALLKTLEEPPPRVILLLTAVDREGVPPTITSRCEMLALRPVSSEDIMGALEARGVEPAVAKQASRMAAGRPRWALRMIDEPGYRERLGEHAASFRKVLGLDMASRFAVAEAWKDGADLEERLSLWLGLASDALSATLVGGQPVEGAWLGELSDSGSARLAVDSILRTLDGLRRNVNARLAVETLMLDLPQLSS